MADTNGNGRVTTRDVLEAVNLSEERLTHRIDRFEESVNRKFKDHDTRLAVLETEQAIEAARSRGIVATLSGIKGFIVIAVAIIAVIVSAAGIIIAGSDYDLHQRITLVEDNQEGE